MPDLIGWEDGERPLLLLEDLSQGHWPPPWDRDKIERLRAALDRLHASPCPPDLPPLESWRDKLKNWPRIAEDPSPFLSLGLCSPDWLGRALPALIAAEEAVPLAGDAPLHMDVRSDNLCFMGDRVVLVDWNWACRGDPAFDFATLLPSLASEGGPPPDELYPDGGPFAAAFSGYFAHRAPQPPPAPGSRVRHLQLSLLKAALPWAARALGLPLPNPRC